MANITLTELTYAMKATDGVSGPAKDAADALKGVGVSVTETDEKLRRAAPTMEQINRRLDENAKHAAAVEAAQRRAAAAIENIRTQAALTNQEAGRTEELIRRELVLRDQQIAKAGQLREAEARRWAGAAPAPAATAQMNAFASANDNAEGSSRRLGQAVQNSAFQVGDFFVQVASGQSAMMAMAQQLPQLLGAFGVIGALSGAAVAIGAVTYNLLAAEDPMAAHERALKRLDQNYQLTMKAAEEWAKGLDAEAAAISRLRDAYRDLEPAQRAYEERRVLRDANTAALARGSLEDEVLDNGSSVVRAVGAARLATDIVNSNRAAGGLPLVEMQPQLAAVERALNAFRLSTGTSAEALLELNQAFAAARDLGGPLTRALDGVVRANDELKPKADETAKSTEGLVQQFYALRDQAGPGAVGALEAFARAARQTLDPLADVRTSISDTRARLAALAAGGLEAREQVKNAQTDAARISTLSAEAAQKEAEALKARGLSQQEINEAVERGAEERTRIVTESVELARKEADAVDAAEKRKREAEAASRRAASAGRAAAREDARQEQAEAKAMATVFDQLRRDGKSGLLVGSESDLKALAAIRNAMKGTPLDPDSVRQSRQEIRRIAQQHNAEQVRENERVVDSITSYVGDAFADVFNGTETNWNEMWKRMSSVALSAVARVAAEMVFRPVGNSLVGGLTGTSSGSSAVNLATAIAAAESGVGGVDYSSILKSSGGLLSGLGSSSRLLSGVINGFDNLAGNALPAVFSTGAGYATPALSSTLGLSSADALYAALPAGPNPSLFGSATSAVGGALGLGAAAYGLYNAFEQGGAKGWASGAGSVAGGVAGASMIAGAGGSVGGTLSLAAPWLAGLGPYAAVAAAVLAIVSAFLPGQKPSDQTGTYAMTLDTGFAAEGGLEGERYNQENRDSARSIAQSIGTIAEQVRTRLDISSTPYAYQVAVGNRDGISLLSNGRTQVFERSEAGSQQLVETATREIIDSMRHAMTADQQAVVNNSGTDLATMLGNLDWYEQVYRPLQQTAEPASAFRDSIQSLAERFQELKDKSDSLGLSTAELTRRHAEQEAELVRARSLEIANDNRSLEVRRLVAQGGDTLDVSLRQFDANADVARQQRETWLRGLDIRGSDFAAQMLIFEQTIGAERLKIITDYNNKIIEEERKAAAERQQMIAGYWQASRTAEGRGYISSVEDIRSNWTANSAAWNAAGLDADRLYTQQMMSYLDTLDAVQLRDVVESFRVLDPAASALAQQFLDLGNAASRATDAQNRQNAQASAAGALDSLANYAAGLATSSASPYSARQQYGMAGNQFRSIAAAAAGGDASAVQDLQQYAGTFLAASQAIHGNGAQYATDFASVVEAIAGVSRTDPEALTQSFMALELRTQTGAFEAAIAKLEARVDVLISVVRNDNRPLRMAN